ncbi:MAG: DUF2299 family protein [Thermoprotei archaeon]|nr:DUF2299 family protein [Thermoprotei archaeon]
MGLKGESLKSQIIEWLTREGLEVRVEPVPPGVPVEWVIIVPIPGPAPINVAVQQPRGRPDVIAVTLGVMVGAEHREALSRLARDDRLILASEMLKSLIVMCPDCAIAIQPSLEDFQFINVTKVEYAESATRERILSTVKLMANAFTLIVTCINSTLASKGLYRKPPREPVVM